MERVHAYSLTREKARTTSQRHARSQVGGGQSRGGQGAALLGVPNLPHSSVPKGAGPEQNQVVREWGSKPRIAQPREHTEIGEKLGLLDFERAAKVSGARFVFYRGALARLELALVQFFL